MRRIKELSGKDKLKESEILEKERRRTLSQFFKTAKKAFELERKTSEGKLRKIREFKLWEQGVPIHRSFLEKVERALRKEIERPKQELFMAIFRKGAMKLLKEMREIENMYKKRVGEKITKWGGCFE
jgi:hypothetical protein